jgi:hypothetical protein
VFAQQHTASATYQRSICPGPLLAAGLPLDLPPTRPERETLQMAAADAAGVAKTLGW